MITFVSGCAHKDDELTEIEDCKVGDDGDKVFSMLRPCNVVCNVAFRTDNYHR